MQCKDYYLPYYCHSPLGETEAEIKEFTEYMYVITLQLKFSSLISYCI